MISLKKDKNNVVTSLADTPVPLKLVCVARPLLKCSEPDFLCKHDWWNRESGCWVDWYMVGFMHIMGYFPILVGFITSQIHHFWLLWTWVWWPWYEWALDCSVLVPLSSSSPTLISMEIYSVNYVAPSCQLNFIECWMFFSQHELYLTIVISSMIGRE